MQLAVPVTHLMDLSTDHPGYDIVREEAYRAFYEPPLADTLLGRPVATGGLGFRSAPAVAAARADALLHVRRYYAVAGGRATGRHFHPRMHELHAQLLRAAAGAAKAVRHRYPGVSMDAVEVFQGALGAMCKGLVDAAVPGVVGALGLLEGSRGGWVLSAEDGINEKLEAASSVRPPHEVSPVGGRPGGACRWHRGRPRLHNNTVATPIGTFCIASSTPHPSGASFV